MPSDEDIRTLIELLTAYRRTLAQLLKQRALISELLAPPSINNGIQEARTEIHRIKDALRAWGVAVDDIPTDDEAPVERLNVPTTIQQPRQNNRLIIGLISTIILLSIVGVTGFLLLINNRLNTDAYLVATVLPFSTSTVAVSPTAVIEAKVILATSTTIPAPSPVVIMIVAASPLPQAQPSVLPSPQPKNLLDASTHVAPTAVSVISELPPPSQTPLPSTSQQERSNDTVSPFPTAGMWITQVTTGSEADGAGFRSQQILISLNDQPITEAETANRIIAQNVGREIGAVVWENGSVHTLYVVPLDNLIGIVLCKLDRCPGGVQP